MAERAAVKAKKRARKAPVQAAKAVPRGGGSASTRDRQSDLEAECLRLRDELAAVKARLQELEAQRELLVNRIDWVIDSLHSLSEE